MDDYVERVLNAVEAIPPGRVCAYSDIAELLGEGGPRQVGRVMGSTARRSPGGGSCVPMDAPSAGWRSRPSRGCGPRTPRSGGIGSTSDWPVLSSPITTRIRPATPGDRNHLQGSHGAGFCDRLVTAVASDLCRGKCYAPRTFAWACGFFAPGVRQQSEP